MDLKHTPGPWHIGLHPGILIYGPKGEQVCDMCADARRLLLPREEITANALLIAAAPELLEVLEMIAHDYEYLLTEKFTTEDAKRIEAAIIRARG